MSDITPFRVQIDDDVVTDLRDRLARTRWPDAEAVDDWSQGLPLAYAQELCAYWRDEYDFAKAEARLNRAPQFRTSLDGGGPDALDVHFVHARSPHEDALPLVLTHGWPGSVVEFCEVIEPLVDPTAHGGDASDAFHVVCPSLPGYGFSDKPRATGWGVPRIARAWAQLMARLGYERYAAQGGDWGSFVTTSIGQQDAAHLVGIHIQLPIAPLLPEMLADLTPVEEHRWPRAPTTAGGTRGTPRSSRPVRRPSGTGLPTRPRSSARGSWRSSGRGPTTTATPRTPCRATTCSTT